MAYRRRRFFRRRTTSRRPFRRTFRRSRYSIRRRALRRRPLRPEIKYRTESLSLQAVAANGYYYRRLTVPGIPRGTSQYTMIGTQVKLRYVITNILVTDDSGITGSTAPNTQSAIRRIIVYVPTKNAAAVDSYLTASGSTLDITTILPQEIFTTLKDVSFTLGATFLNADLGITGVLSAGGVQNQRMLRWKIPFPRNADLGIDETLDPNKDVMYILVLNGKLATKLSFYTKLTFCDA